MGKQRGNNYYRNRMLLMLMKLDLTASEEQGNRFIDSYVASLGEEDFIHFYMRNWTDRNKVLELVDKYKLGNPEDFIKFMDKDLPIGKNLYLDKVSKAKYKISDRQDELLYKATEDFHMLAGFEETVLKKDIINWKISDTLILGKNYSYALCRVNADWTVRDLLKMSLKEMSSIRNIGDSTVRVIMETLSKLLKFEWNSWINPDVPLYENIKGNDMYYLVLKGE